MKFRENRTLQEYMIGRIARLGYHAGCAEVKDIYPYQKSSVNLFVKDLH